ncbi:MAG: helix-turn-helix domain-containing protein, partial [Micromonosporaceae bacterium]|nr:helix-turn-helix domain-containing protein [Micromonosporaceae bacterium]
KPSRLAAALAERGMTATGLARAVNVTPSTVGKWADGAAPTVEHAEGATAALGVEVAEVFDRVHLGHRGGRSGRLELPLVPGAPTVDQALDTPPTGDDRWAERAACADPDLDPEAWWPDPTDPAEQARRTCGGCPVLGDCRQAFLDDPNTRRHGTDGIWAGLPGRVLLTLTRNPNRDGGRDHTTQGLTSTRLAADLGVSPSTVAHWRQGQRTPSPAATERLAHRLGVDPDQLWPDRDQSRDGIAR